MKSYNIDNYIDSRVDNSFVQVEDDTIYLIVEFNDDSYVDNLYSNEEDYEVLDLFIVKIDITIK